MSGILSFYGAGLLFSEALAMFAEAWQREQLAKNRPDLRNLRNLINLIGLFYFLLVSTLVSTILYFSVSTVLLFVNSATVVLSQQLLSGTSVALLLSR